MTQSEFAAALVDFASTIPAGLVAWNGSDPTVRLGVYRNNVLSSLLAALADTYPAVRWWCGEEPFDALARRYAARNLPTSPVMARYGEILANFLREDCMGREQPELVDLARLEWAYVRSFHAADATPLQASELDPLLAKPEAIPRLRFELHPSVQVVMSRYPILGLWSRAQSGDEGGTNLPKEPQSALLVRQGPQCRVLNVEAATCELVQGLIQGSSLGEAVDRAVERDAAFDTARALALLIREQGICAVHE